VTSPARRRAAARRKRVFAFRDTTDPRGFVVLLKAHLEHMKVRGYSPRTVLSAEWSISDFVVWSQERDVMKPRDVTKPMIERYQRMLFYTEKPDGSPLTLSTQHHRLSFIKQYFKWLARENHLLSNPASELELPKVEKRLPKHVLTATEAEAILAQPDIRKPQGLRDRAILETFYSTGIRRTELSGLKVHDVDTERGTITVRQGKGRRDRVVPVGERAGAWIAKYIREARPDFVIEPDRGFIFLAAEGEPIAPKTLSLYVSRYVKASGVARTGSCHLFRHAMATLMLENGADVRMIQAILGHVKLTTTEIYTHVAITKLKQVHTATHPAALLFPGAPVSSRSEGN